MMTLDALSQTGLVRPGSLVRWRYKVRMDDQREAALTQAIEQAEARFPQAGWSVRDRRNASPRIAGQIERFRDYLTLVGLTALAVGGVGVANAVRAHLDGGARPSPRSRRWARRRADRAGVPGPGADPWRDRHRPSGWRWAW